MCLMADFMSLQHYTLFIFTLMIIENTLWKIVSLAESSMCNITKDVIHPYCNYEKEKLLDCVYVSEQQYIHSFLW